MIKCAVCQGRVRPPTRPWQEVPGGVHFYKAGFLMKEYVKWLTALAKRMPFVHEDCKEAAAPGTLPERYIVALDLDTRLRLQQRKGR